MDIWKTWDTYEELTKGLDLSKLSDEQLKKLFELKIECERRKRTSPIRFYKPYESNRKPGYKPQEVFHRSNANVRLVLGGNRSGKTESGAAELVMAAEGVHPFIKFPVPGEYWVVSLTNQMSIEVAQDKVRKWLSPQSILKWDNKYGVCYLRNGSKIGFKSCEQEINTFGGTAKDGIWFDEEPPGEHGYQIYKECRMRTIDRGGKIWFTMTPVQGMSWTADEIYEPAVAGDPNYFCLEMSTYDNPHLSKNVIQEIEKDCTEDEKEMRFFGKYIQFSGLVYKEFDRNIHIVKPFPIPRHWKKYRSIDHGINNPTACVWLAVNEKDEYFVYDEYYQTDKTVSENAQIIKSITGGDNIEWTTIDPSTNNRDAITNTSIREEYRKHGVFTKAERTEKMSGINTIKQLLMNNASTGRPRLFFFDTCYATLKEMQRYRWKKYRGKEDVNASEEPQKVLDHALDALRYLVMSKPIYKTDEEESEPDNKWYI